MARKELNKATWRRARARQKLAYPACAACGTTSRLEADHIIPPKLGGSDDPSNIRTLCATCNKRKGDRIMSLAALRAGLHTQPAPTVPARTVYTSRPSRPWQPITGDYSTRRP
jgi:5-methylcytosine-specific restriction endonuclease McrA